MNYDELTNELGSLFKDIKAKKIEPAVAHELNATVQNIHHVVRLGLLNAKLKGELPNLEFFKAARKKATNPRGVKRG